MVNTSLSFVTDYTLLKSLITIDDLISYSCSNNIKVLGILNDNLYSTVEFYTKCINNNIKPIIGLIKYIDDLEYYIYPKNYDGLKDLYNEIYDSNNLICVIPYNNIKLFDKIKCDKYISYNNKDELKNSLLKTSNVVYLNKIYSLNKDDVKYVNYLYMIDKGLTISNYNFNDFLSNVLNKLDKYDLDTIYNFSKLIDINIKINNKFIPKFCDNSYSHLCKLCVMGLNKRFNNNVSDIYKNRLKFELDVINSMGYVDYFLIVYDYVKYAKNNDIMVGPGRGSAAGSLVSYSLGITNIDPIKYDLLFERFLNKDRITMPDIDIDFDSVKRYKVIDYVVNKYGRECVSNIMTYSTLSSKQVLRDVSKVLEIDNKIIDKICNYMDSKVSLKDNLNLNVRNMLNQFSNLKNSYYISMKLEGIKRQIGTHAAGVVISSIRLTDIIPVIKNKDNYLTGCTMEYLEDLGLLKMDFLAIKDLSILSDILNEIEIHTGNKININNIDLNDIDTYLSFSNANTSGVFQFESSGMKNFLLKLKPNCFDDLVAALALFRPGPMSNIDTYIKRKNGYEKVSYLNDKIKNVLSSTYGIMIYQEQIMQILSIMGGYSFSEADIIRRAISKKKLDVINQEKERFISKSVGNGYNFDDAVSVYNDIVKFANYGFNKSHSVAYAKVGYVMCYLKTHYPLYFYEAMLNYNIGSELKTKEYLGEIKKLGIDIVKPDINISTSKYIVKDNKLILPFNIIKNIGNNVSDIIVNNRKDKYNDYFDFVKSINVNNIGVKTIEQLIFAGCLDSFNINKHTMIENLGNAITYSELSSGIGDDLISKPILKDYSEYDNNYLMELESNLFGFYISNHPIMKYNNSVKLINLDMYFDKFISLYVLVEDIKKIKTKNNKTMSFVSISDESCKSELIVFDNKINLLNDISKNDIVKISGKVEKRFDKYQIILNNIIKDIIN